MKEIQMQIAKELTLASLQNLQLSYLDKNKNPENIAATVGEMFQIIFKKVSEMK